MFPRTAPLMVLMALVLLSGTYATAATLSVPGSYSTIQAAIDAANAGDEVVVAPGTYYQCLKFKGKDITVRSTDPTNPTVVATTIINGGAAYSVVWWESGETRACVLSGFTITNGRNAYGAGMMVNWSSPTITYNVITGNTGTAAEGNVFGGGIYTYDSTALIAHNTISNNTCSMHGGGMLCSQGGPTISDNVIKNNTTQGVGGGIHLYQCNAIVTGNTISGNQAVTQYGGGLSLLEGSPTISGNTISGNSAAAGGGGGLLCGGTATPSIKNNIIASNTGGGGLQFQAASHPVVTYNDVYSNTGGNYVGMTDQTGTNGNISANPLFANAAAGDFHEKAIAGRWNGSAWVNDAVVSPCIDAGDPASSYANEPAPNGGRVNMGAYGNTAYASKSGSVLPTAPTIASATYVDPTHVNLIFSKALNAATVGAVGNYSVSPSLAVSAATLDADTKTVHLTTAAQTLSATYIVTVSGVKDTLGNAIVAGSGDTASWTPSAVVPTVIAALPTGTHESAANPIITAAFSTAMNKPTTQGALSITPAQSGAAAPGWPGAFTWVGNQMQYKLSTALAPNTTYTVTISTAAQSSGGRTMAAAKVWSFTTSGAPAVACVTPTGTAVPVGSNLTVTFNTSMLRTSVNGALTINGVKASIFGGRFTWVGSKLTFNPTKNLAASTSYKVVIGTGAKSAAGVNMAKACNWTFKTKPAAAPTLTLTAATGLPVGSGVAFPISLSADASVGVEILSLAGRVVGTIPARECVAGTTTLTWNGRGAYGTASPAGAYLCHVNAFGKDGSRANALSRFVLRR